MKRSSTLILLGKGLVKPSKDANTANQESKMTLESKFTCEAGRLLLLQENIRNLIICGGQVIGKSLPSEADTMLKYIDEHCSIVNNCNVYLEKNSLTTLQNARGAKNIMITKNLLNSSSYLVTCPYHIARAKRIFCDEGMQIEPISSLDILSGEERRDFEDYLISTKGKYEQLKERAISITSFLFGDSFLDKFSGITRG